MNAAPMPRLHFRNNQSSSQKSSSTWEGSIPGPSRRDSTESSQLCGGAYPQTLPVRTKSRRQHKHPVPVESEEESEDEVFTQKDLLPSKKARPVKQAPISSTQSSSCKQFSSSLSSSSDSSEDEALVIRKGLKAANAKKSATSAPPVSSLLAKGK